MRKTIILLHGALGAKAQLEPLQDLLSDRYEVHTLNLSGHGGSPLPDVFNIGTFVQDVVRYMDENHLDQTHLFGYSMGGYVALQMARDYPGRAGRVVTLGTKFRWDPESAAKEVRMMNAEVIEQKIPHFAAGLRERHAPQDWKKIMRCTAEMMTELGAGLSMKESHFRSIAHEVLVSRGTDDHMVGEEESRQVAGWLPQGRYLEISGWKHPIESVDMEWLSSMCRAWYHDGQIVTV